MDDEIEAPLIRKGRHGRRAGGQRSRTGCATCRSVSKLYQTTMPFSCLTFNRIRHVKCDEEKPACRECRRTGRACDGYGNNGTKHQIDTPSMLYGKVLGLPAAVIADFHTNFLKFGEERKYYEYFQHSTRHQINLAFGSSTRVHQLLLQTSHSNESIKHTVIALGSLTEHLSGTKLLSQGLLEEKERLHYADTHYLKGISKLQQDMAATTKPSPELVLISCMLLSLFDFLRGEEVGGKVHLAAGLDILRNCFASELPTLMASQFNQYQQPNLLIEDFARIFTVMDLHSAIWLGRPCFHAPPVTDLEMYMPPPFHLGVDPPLDDIADSLNYQIMRAHTFHHANAPNDWSPAIASDSFHILAEKDRLLFELQQWSSRLEKYCSALPQPTEDQRYRVALMRMGFYSLLVTISSFFTESLTSAYDTLEEHYRGILHNAKLLLQPPSASNRDRLLRAVAVNCHEPDPYNITIFAFVSGAIQPLHLTATKSGNPRLREEAISLLEEKPWREGAWDSSIMARLARRELEARSKNDQRAGDILADSPTSSSE